ncbi:MAG: lipopolysaccharide biosynthesis protein [Candidatus Odinarchaeota archaeon]
MADSIIDSSIIDGKRRVIRGGVFLTFSPAASLILGLVITVLIGIYILPEEYAIFEWFNVLTSIFITIIPFQLPSAIGRYVAVAKGANNPDEIDQLAKSSTALSLILVPLSGLIAFLLTPFLFTAIGIGTSYSIIDILLFSFGIMCMNLSSFAVSMSSGLQEFEKLGIGQFLGNVLSQGFLMVLIPLGWGIRALILKWALLGLVLSIFLTLSVRRIWTLRGFLYPLKPLIEFAYPSIIAFFFAYLFNELLIRSIFQNYIDQSELGLYGFAVRLTTFINALTLGFNNAIGPHYSVAVGQGGTQALEGEVRWTLRMSFFLFLPLIIGAIIIAPAAFELVFTAYYWSYKYFAVLMIQLFFFLLVRPYASVLGAVAKTKQVLASAIVSSVASGILMIVFIDYGLLFVVIGYASVAFFSALINALWIKKEVKISLSIRQILPITIVSFAAIIPAVMIHYLRLGPLIEIASIVLMFIFVYVTSIRLLKLVTVNEIQKAVSFLPSRIAQPLSHALIRIFTRTRDESSRLSEGKSLVDTS